LLISNRNRLTAGTVYQITFCLLSMVKVWEIFVPRRK